VLVDDIVNKSIQIPTSNMEFGIHTLQIQPTEEWEEISEIESSKEFGEFLQYGDESVLIGNGSRSESGAEGDVHSMVKY